MAPPLREVHHVTTPFGILIECQLAFKLPRSAGHTSLSGIYLISHRRKAKAYGERK